MEQPTALTIDFTMGGRLFWADVHKNVIESCKPDGSDRTTMLTDAGTLYNYIYRGTAVVDSSSVNSFKNNLDNNQEVYYNFRCDITGTGLPETEESESELISNNVLKYVIKRWT